MVKPSPRYFVSAGMVGSGNQFGTVLTYSQQIQNQESGIVGFEWRGYVFGCGMRWREGV